MKRHAIGITVVALVAWAGALAAQVPDDWAQRVPQAALADVESLVREAAGEGLPTAPLIQKALEGSIKGVEPERIARTVRIFRAELRDAHYLLMSVRPSAAADEADIVAVAFALHRGLRPAEVRELLAVAPDEARDVALQIAADIAARGYTPEEASRLVSDAIAQRLSPRELMSLPRSVSAELERGVAPDEAMNRVRVQVLRGQPGRAP